jgi:hypothetical protein
MQSILTPLLTPFLTALFAVLLGYPLARYWQERQKRRELALATTDKFYRVYGDFFKVWKLWNYTFIPHPSGDEVTAEEREETRVLLSDRITSAESELEGIIVKVACERTLAPHEVEALGKFREAYQQLRNAIRDRKRLNWASREDPKYVAYKRSSAAVAYLISTLELVATPSPYRIIKQIEAITAKRWEREWTEPFSPPSEVRDLATRLGLRLSPSRKKGVAPEPLEAFDLVHSDS